MIVTVALEKIKPLFPIETQSKKLSPMKTCPVCDKILIPLDNVEIVPGKTIKLICPVCGIQGEVTIAKGYVANDVIKWGESVIKAAVEDLVKTGAKNICVAFSTDNPDARCEGEQVVFIGSGKRFEPRMMMPMMRNWFKSFFNL